MHNTLKAMSVAGVLSLFCGPVIAQDSPEPRASAVRVIFVAVSEDGTTIVDCTGVDCATEDCSGNENDVVSGVPIRIRRTEEDVCASESLTLEEAEEFEDALLELDDLLLIDTDPDDGGSKGGGPIKIDPPYLKEDEDNQRKVGDPTPATKIKISP